MLTDEERGELKQMCSDLGGLAPVARRIGLAQGTTARLIAGIQSFSGTVFQARSRLPSKNAKGEVAASPVATAVGAAAIHDSASTGRG
jgi:hypothetical protein